MPGRGVARTQEEAFVAVRRFIYANGGKRRFSGTEIVPQPHHQHSSLIEYQDGWNA